jgi:hypothetical protein
MDFRTAAADGTLRKVQEHSASALENLGESGCVHIPGGRGALVWISVLFGLVVTVCVLATLGVSILGFTDLLPRRLVLQLLALSLLVSLFTRSLRSTVVKYYLSTRPDSWLRLLPQLKTNAVGLEEGATYRKTKFVVEDQGLCLLDPERHRFLLEGCAYRYVVYARDVVSVEPVSNFALSGARVRCRIAEQLLDFVLTVAPGPFASLVQTFAPHVNAAGLAMVLNRTLFGAESPSFTQQTLPPPLPGA